MNNEGITQKRLAELSHRAYERGYPTFTEFLNLDEISTLQSLSLDSGYTLYGGYPNAERCMAGFGDSLTDEDFSIVCLKIAPVNKKFADALNHRDFLGALMNLGINRSTLGDIVIKDGTGYLFCLESISGYILQSLDRIKHTTVKVETAAEIPSFVTALPEETEIIVSSLRADAVIASAYRLSRSEAAQLFSREKVFINAKMTTKESALLKEHDIVSVRGYGKFIFEGAARETKKKRIVISVRIY